MKFEITVIHKFEGLDLLLQTLSDLAASKIPKPPPPEPEKPKPNPMHLAFMTWVNAQGFEEWQRGDYVGLYESLVGIRPADASTIARARIVLNGIGAPLPVGL